MPVQPLALQHTEMGVVPIPVILTSLRLLGEGRRQSTIGNIQHWLWWSEHKTLARWLQHSSISHCASMPHAPAEDLLRIHRSLVSVCNAA